MLHIKSISFITATSSIILLSVLGALTSCHKTNNDNTEALPADSIMETQDEFPARSEALKGIVALEQHMSSGNAKGFAADCSYPIQRPYPLRNIKDSAEMENYFPVMVDDSIKTAVRNAQFERWHSNGWKGWTLDDGRYLWWDGKVYAVSYLSKAEKALRKKLVDQELESLDPSLRAGWQPYFCLINPETGTIYRIDVASGSGRPTETTQADDDQEFTNITETAPDGVAPRFRMLVYPRYTDLHALPADSLSGSMIIEGSAGTRTLTFMNQKGETMQFDMDAADEDNLPNLSTFTPSDTTNATVDYIYWRDYLSLPR